MSAVVSTASFGFDLSHQKCVNSMMGRDEDSNEDYEEQSNLAKKVSEELKQATQLLRRYRELKQSRLYRLLHKVKPITGNLMPTNILRMDKNYHKVYLAWPELMKVMHTIDTMPRIGESGAAITGEEMQSSYSEFIETIVGFAAHSLSFEEVEHNHFLRSTDDVFMQIHPNDDGLLIMDIGREIDYRITVTGQLESPIAPGATDGIFSFDGKTIHWHSKAGDGDIEYFARKLKTRESRGAQRAEEARRYRSLKVALTAENDSKDARVYRVLIVPSITALDDQSQIRYVDDMRAKMTGMIEKNNVNMAVVCMPLCRPNEQAVTNYGYQSDGNIALLPVSMFDINSYRRFRLTLLRFIAEITDNCCPCCGNIATKDKNGGLVCYSCDNLQVITTTCLNEKCGRSFKYLNYGISADVRRKMYEESISDKSDESSFFRHDSLFQYKNIVPMSVNPNKIGPICPFCATLE